MREILFSAKKINILAKANPLQTQARRFEAKTSCKSKIQNLLLLGKHVIHILH